MHMKHQSVYHIAGKFGIRIRPKSCDFSLVVWSSTRIPNTPTRTEILVDFNLAVPSQPPNSQIKFPTKFSSYTAIHDTMNPIVIRGDVYCCNFAVAI